MRSRSARSASSSPRSRPSVCSTRSRKRRRSAPRSAPASRVDLVTPPARGAERAPGLARLRCAARPARHRRSASSTSSWYAGRASRRCSNCPDIAISRSVAAARSSRAIARPHAYARVRPSAKTRRARTSPGSSSGRSSCERLQLDVVEEAVRDVELGLDVRLVRGRPDGTRVTLDAEEEPDRLGEDRLARARSRR